VGSLTALQTLGLHQNQLTSLPAEVGSLTALLQLNLDQNQLTSLPAEVGSLTALQTLALAQNQLTSLPLSMSNLGSNSQWRGMNVDSTQRHLLKALRPPLTNVRVVPVALFCAWCYVESGAEPGTKLLQCIQCKRVWYCCKEHQLLHWKLAHKKACKALQQVVSSQQDTDGGGEGASAGVKGSNEQGEKAGKSKGKKKKRR
jgi:hypothetical protein